jgi:hypothetical protein
VSWIDHGLISFTVDYDANTMTAWQHVEGDRVPLTVNKARLLSDMLKVYADGPDAAFGELIGGAA